MIQNVSVCITPKQTMYPCALHPSRPWTRVHRTQADHGPVCVAPKQTVYPCVSHPSRPWTHVHRTQTDHVPMCIPPKQTVYPCALLPSRPCTRMHCTQADHVPVCIVPKQTMYLCALHPSRLCTLSQLPKPLGNVLLLPRRDQGQQKTSQHSRAGPDQGQQRITQHSRCRTRPRPTENHTAQQGGAIIPAFEHAQTPLKWLSVTWVPWNQEEPAWTKSGAETCPNPENLMLRPAEVGLPPPCSGSTCRYT